MRRYQQRCFRQGWQCTWTPKKYWSYSRASTSFDRQGFSILLLVHQRQVAGSLVGARAAAIASYYYGQRQQLDGNSTI